MLECTSGWLRSELMLSRIEGCLGALIARFRGGTCFEMSWRAWRFHSRRGGLPSDLLGVELFERVWWQLEH